MLHAALHSIAHSIICTRLFCGKMHSDRFNGIEILQGRWQHGQKVGYCYPSGLEKTFCKWDIYVPLVTKRLTTSNYHIMPLFLNCPCTDYINSFAHSTVNSYVFSVSRTHTHILRLSFSLLLYKSCFNSALGLLPQFL